MHQSQPDVRECHAGDVLSRRHAVAGLDIGGILDGLGQPLGNHLDGFGLEHIAHFPCAQRNQALDRVRQRIHAGRCGQTARHRKHQLGVDDRERRDVVRIDAYHFFDVLLVRNHVVDRHLGSRAGRRRQRDDGNRLFLRIGYALERHHVGELGVVDDDPDRLRGIHRRAAADRDHEIGSGRLERGDAGLHVLHGRVRLHFVENLVRNVRILQHGNHLIGYAELDQILVGHDQRLLVTALGNLFRDYLSRAGSEIGGLVENHSVSHNDYV